MASRAASPMRNVACGMRYDRPETGGGPAAVPFLKPHSLLRTPHCALHTLFLLASVLGAVCIAAGCEDPSLKFNKAGLEAYRGGDYSRARAGFEEAIQQNPDVGEYYFNRAMAEQALGNLRPAIFSYDMATRLSPGIVAAYQNAATCLMQLGEPQKALAELVKGTQANPFNGQAFINLAKFYLSQDDIYNTKLALAKAAAADPDNAAVHREYGRFLIQTGDRKKGLEELRKSLEIEPLQPALSAEVSKLAPPGDQLPPPKPMTKSKP